MHVLKALGIVVLLAGPLTPVAAHPHPYVAFNDSHWVLDWLGLTCPEATEIGPGYVCFPGFEAEPGLSGSVLLTIVDAVAPELVVRGFYCQDLNQDSLCGDDGTIAIVEPGVSFCRSLLLGEPAGARWDNAMPVYVFVEGPAGGITSNSECPVAMTGSTGVVEHTPA